MKSMAKVQTKMTLFRIVLKTPRTQEDIDGAPDAVVGATELMSKLPIYSN
jgi:hypothetical protein